MTTRPGRLTKLAFFLREQWYGPQGFRAMVTVRFWWDFLRVIKKSGWYLAAFIIWTYYAGYNIAHGGFAEISGTGTNGQAYHFFYYFGLPTYFWGLGTSILALALFGKIRAISRDFANESMRVRLSQLGNVACWVDCCKDPACQCGDCLLCGKVLPDTEQVDRAYVEKLRGLQT